MEDFILTERFTKMTRAIPHLLDVFLQVVIVHTQKSFMLQSPDPCPLVFIFMQSLSCQRLSYYHASIFF